MQEIKCLDHGYVKLVGSFGNDETIVQSARVSYGAGTKTKRADNQLIDYLLRNYHMSPFEIVNFTFEWKMPIFVARQAVRHRTARLNEISGRYSVLPSEFYVPELSRVNRQSTDNKQGSSTEILPNAEDIIGRIVEHQKSSYETYEWLLEQGYSRELARNVLPVDLYTKWIWQCDLRNLMNFLYLRQDSHAQYEIRQYANAVHDLIQPIVPVALECFKKHKVKSKTLSEDELEILKGIFIDYDIDLADYNMKGSAKKELKDKIYVRQE